MNITLCDLNKEICEAWEQKFSAVSNVTVKCQDIFSCGKFDAITSPANSYGEMSGGIDGVYTKYFGQQLQDRLQDFIKKMPMQEVLIGQAVVIETLNANIPYLISAPTMRVPLNVSKTANPYLAFKASLIAAKDMNFKKIICPGLGTLTGDVSPDDCARQMFCAYNDFINGTKFPESIYEAYQNHKYLVGAR